MGNTFIFKYPSIRETDNQWGLTITTIGYHKISNHMNYPPEGHPGNYNFDPENWRVLNEYQLIYITRGSGTFRSKDSGTIIMNEGDMFIVFPGEKHIYTPDPDTGWDEYWVGFQGENIDRLVKKGFFTPASPKYTIGINDDIVLLYNKIIEAASDESRGFQQLMVGILYNLLGIIYTSKPSAKLPGKDSADKINKAKIIMRDNVAGNITPESIAAGLNLSYSWFRRAFKEQTGLSPAKYMNTLKLGKAKSMLVNTGMSIKEISLSLNFDNIEYFSTFFKKMTGKTPVEYRTIKQKQL